MISLLWCEVGLEGWDGIGVVGEGWHEAELELLPVRRRKARQNTISEFQGLETVVADVGSSWLTEHCTRGI